MRAFNPMLSILSVGELMLTPRGLLALANRSIRSVRQQVKAVEEVGEEIAKGGREVFHKSTRMLNADVKPEEQEGLRR